MPKVQLLPATDAPPAPPWSVSEWMNHDGDLSLEDLRGRVVVVHAFQMLCPGCVAHGIPQAQLIAATFPEESVAVVGLHTVFEHHDAMLPVSLRAFLHEYRVRFPVGVDTRDPDQRLPQTMRTYEMQGTPSLLLIDRAGRLRLHAFGRPDDMALGAAIATLVAEDAEAPAGCDADGCRVPESQS